MWKAVLSIFLAAASTAFLSEVQAREDFKLCGYDLGGKVDIAFSVNTKGFKHAEGNSTIYTHYPRDKYIKGDRTDLCKKISIFFHPDTKKIIWIETAAYWPLLGFCISEAQDIAAAMAEENKQFIRFSEKNKSRFGASYYRVSDRYQLRRFLVSDDEIIFFSTKRADVMGGVVCRKDNGIINEQWELLVFIEKPENIREASDLNMERSNKKNHKENKKLFE